MKKKQHLSPYYRRLDMIEAILHGRLSNREIAAWLDVSKTTVGRHRDILHKRGITAADEVRAMSKDELEALFNKRPNARSIKHQPDWDHVHEEMKRKGVTRLLLWREYRTALLQQGQSASSLLSYTQFAFRYSAHRQRLPLDMRQHHTPGEAAFVDYSGDRPHYIDGTGKRVKAELFVGGLPGSSLIFATCTATQRVPDFIAAHVRMWDYFGGVPLVLVPDNLKSAVIKPGKEPVLQRAYQDFARYYDIAVVPARVRRPRDKAMVESSVCIVQREILAPLRHKAFHSLDALNQAVAEQLKVLNARPMRKDGKSRRERFETMERHALRPLPVTPYAYGEFLEIPSVPQDYHVNIRGHEYSVPHTLIGHRLDARLSGDGTTIDILDGRTVVATHVRSAVAGGATTLPEHQPPNHRHQAEQGPEALRAWATAQGGAIHRFVAHQFAHASQPFHAVPACQRLRSLCDKHTDEVLQEACQRAFDLNVPTISTVQRFLGPSAASTRKTPTVSHSKARGQRRNENRRHDRRDDEIAS